MVVFGDNEKPSGQQRVIMHTAVMVLFWKENCNFIDQNSNQINEKESGTHYTLKR
jgi:hypothetical protein